jgi:F0F1-type ATP synthase assembly protein I
MDQMARHAGVGIQFAATLVIMTLAGHWLDTRLGTVPLFLILGMLLGFLGATIALIRQVSPPRDKGDGSDGL